MTRKQKQFGRFAPFVEYIRSLSGPLLSSTVHNATLESYKNNTTPSVGRNSLEKWKILVSVLGENEAKMEVQEWLDHPYQLKG